MRKIWNKGHRIRASDKHLVYHFSIGTLLFIFVAVLLLLNIKQLMRTDWEHFSLLENGLTLSPYNFITILIATGVCALVVFLYYRFCYDSFKKLLHRQKLARMILENKWYEADTIQDSVFFTDLQSRSREKIVWFPKIYYQMEKGLLHIRCEITLGKYQDQLLRLPPNSLDTESSIKQGCKYFASLLSSCKNQGIDDLNVAIQSYNYGGGYVGYVAGKGKKHTFNLAESFAREKSGGKKVTYTNPIAVAKNGGWRYGYGNMFYVEVVNQYLAVPQVSGELAQKVMNEALKYQGWKYVYGGSNPNTSFDCSGLTQWCYGKAGISLPRTAQAQYDATQHLPLSQAKAGDLVFFHSTYNAGSYVTHVGILVSPTQMYHAGDPIGYADLSSSYWQQHLIGAGRVKQ